MRQNRPTLLAFAKFNKGACILPWETKALLELFCHLGELDAWIGQVTNTIHLD